MRTCLPFAIAAALISQPLEGKVTTQSRSSRRSIEPQTTLEKFWSGVQKDWLPKSANEVWPTAAKRKTREYCRAFAARSDARQLLPEMIRDLTKENSAIRSFIYTWVVIEWDPRKARNTLKTYDHSKDPIEKQVAADFLAEIEENEREAKEIDVKKRRKTEHKGGREEQALSGIVNLPPKTVSYTYDAGSEGPTGMALG